MCKSMNTVKDSLHQIFFKVFGKREVGLSPASKNCLICFTEGQLKMMKNVFFHLKNSFRSQDI